MLRSSVTTAVIFFPSLFHRGFETGLSNDLLNNKDSPPVVTDDCERYISTFDVKNGMMKKVIGGNRSFGSLEFHPDGSWVTSMSDSQLPSEFYALKDGNLRRLTSIQDDFVAGLSLATVEIVGVLGTNARSYIWIVIKKYSFIKKSKFIFV